MDSTVLLLRNDPRFLRGQVLGLMAQLHAVSPAEHYELLGEMCEQPVGERLSPRYMSADEVWRTADGRGIRVGDMKPEHLGHSLAMILRRLREEPNSVWRMDPESGRMRFISRHFKRKDAEWREY